MLKDSFYLFGLADSMLLLDIIIANILFLVPFILVAQAMTRRYSLQASVLALV